MIIDNDMLDHHHVFSTESTLAKFLIDNFNPLTQKTLQNPGMPCVFPNSSWRSVIDQRCCTHVAQTEESPHSGVFWSRSKRMFAECHCQRMSLTQSVAT
jgi:hypothetical protein